MWNIIKEYRHYVATLILAIIPLIALNAGGKAPAELRWFDKAAIAISAPAQSIIRWTIDSSWNLVDHYLLLLDTKTNNQALALENRKLLNEIAAFQELSKENERLRSLVDFNAPLEGRKIVARVIAQDISPEFRMIRLDKGSEQGVVNGMAVVSLEGVVGRIIRVGSKYSDVLTLLDSSSAIDALVQRNRVRGTAEGLGSSALSLKYLRRTDDVQEGDLIISSGIGGLFPKGLNVGKVTSVKKQNYGISQSVELVPSVDFSKLEEVTVIDPPKLPLEEASLEKLDSTKGDSKNEKTVAAKTASTEKPTEKKPVKPADGPKEAEKKP